jgi:hypothetical protein
MLCDSPTYNEIAIVMINVVVYVTLIKWQLEFSNNWHISTTTPGAKIVYSLFQTGVHLKRTHTKFENFFERSAHQRQ